MRIFCFFIIAGVFGSSYASKKPNSVIRGYQLIINLPSNLYQENGETKINTFTDTVSVFYVNEMVVYRLAGTMNFASEVTDPESRGYFCFAKNNRFGWHIPGKKEKEQPERAEVDSFLLKWAHGGINIELDYSGVILAGRYNDSSHGKLMEKYAVIDNDGEAKIDSAYFSFDSSLNDLEYSLSPKMDSIYKKKLCEIRFIFTPMYSTSLKMNLPKRTVLYEIKRDLQVNAEEITGVIKKFNELERKP